MSERKARNSAQCMLKYVRGQARSIMTSDPLHRKSISFILARSIVKQRNVDYKIGLKKR